MLPTQKSREYKIDLVSKFCINTTIAVCLKYRSICFQDAFPSHLKIYLEQSLIEKSDIGNNR